MKPEYQFARLECEHKSKNVLRSAQNAATIVKSADRQVQETSEIQKLFFNKSTPGIGQVDDGGLR